MDIRQLRYFVTVHEEMSFTRAARKLYVSQPTLSKAIKNMESELNEPLFDRESPSLRLTDIGEALLVRARSILTEFDGITSAAQELKNLQTGKLTVAIPPVITSLYFTEVIADFRQCYPGIDLSVREATAADIIAQIRNNALDLGVTIQPVPNDLVSFQHLFSHETVAIMRRDHPLARKETLAFSDLRREPLNLFSEGFALYGETTKRCRYYGFEPVVNVTSSQCEFLTMTARAGNGITILPLPVVPQLPSDMCWRSFTPKYPWDIICVWKKNCSLSYAAYAFVARAQQSFSRRVRPSSKPDFSRSLY